MNILKFQFLKIGTTLLTLSFVLASCGLGGAGSINTNIYSDVDMKFLEGTCQYAQYRTEETLCNFEVQIRNKGKDPIRISGDFKYSVVSVNDQKRWKNGLDERYEYKNLAAREITHLSSTNPWSSIAEIDETLNPVEKRVVTLAFQVPTNTWVHSISLLVSRANPDSEERYIHLDLNICAFGDKSNGGQIITRELICNKGFAAHG